MSDKSQGIREHIAAAKNTSRPEQLLGQSELAAPTGLCLKVESCRDCPRLEINKVKTFLGSGYEYICAKAGRHIYPHEGVNPPPEWCPLRHNDPAQALRPEHQKP